MNDYVQWAHRIQMCLVHQSDYSNVLPEPCIRSTPTKLVAYAKHITVDVCRLG